MLFSSLSYARVSCTNAKKIQARCGNAARLDFGTQRDTIHRLSLPMVLWVSLGVKFEILHWFTKHYSALPKEVAASHK